MQIHLSNGGASLVLRQTHETFEIVHWGAALGEIKPESLKIADRSVPHGGLDVSPKNLILREHSRCCNGRPALLGHRNGKSVSNYFTIKNSEATKDSATLTFADSIAGLEITLTYKLDSHGILIVQSKLTNVAEGDYTVNQLINWLPIPVQASELIDFYGHWSKERQPQRREIPFGITVREGFEGRSGHDYTIASIALTPATNFATGEAWSIALSWSGNNSHFAEKLIDGNSAIGAGENLLPGEVILAKGESYNAPKVIAAYSDHG
ncbi:MAG: glycoside hydrolase family 36 N-terminal domain-containing protein, partial [Candidatus Nanopelagicaceae bacterium]